MTTFVTVLHHNLASKINLPPTPSRPGTPALLPTSTDDLRAYYLQLNPPTSLEDAAKCVDTYEAFQQKYAFAQSSSEEEEFLQVAILAKLVIGLYVQTLELCLNEATEVETELDWWADVERSRRSSAYYLLQTLPLRIVNVAGIILSAVRRQNIPLSPSVFTPSSLRRLFPSRNILRPNTLTVALFPHLRHESYPATLLSVQANANPVERVRGSSLCVHQACSHVSRILFSSLHSPVTLARHECSFKRKKLEAMRDERAAALGHLVGLTNLLELALGAESAAERFQGLQAFVNGFSDVLQPAGSGSRDLTKALSSLVRSSIPRHISSHNEEIALHGLRRPSRLTLIWPKLVLIPPLALFAARSLYNSRDSLNQTIRDAVETLRGFWEDWLLGPLKDVVKTVRAGSDEGVIITKESVKADLESLERMALSLARDKLNYTAEQMTALSVQIRQGDLTPVMQIYEDDIRSPLKSVVGGTLLRTLLVQVQKAKVDIDQALAGIDKLLKSQELTFAFVGVAPAFAVVYVSVGYVRSIWVGSRGKGRFGGVKRRWHVWSIVRRIERLLICSTSTIDPRTAGLLLLSTTHLRAYATNHLPPNSRLREGFLDDVGHLESPTLGREEKLRVVDRMWNAWGQVLGWRDIADSR